MDRANYSAPNRDIFLSYTPGGIPRIGFYFWVLFLFHILAIKSREVYVLSLFADERES